MALVLRKNDDGTLTLLDQEEKPWTRARLLADTNFTAQVTQIVGHIKSLKFDEKENILNVPSIVAQFNACIEEEKGAKGEADGEADAESETFDVRKWFKEHYKAPKLEDPQPDDTDWLDLLMTQELKHKGFCRSLLNCIDMEDKLETTSNDWVNRSYLPGAYGVGSSKSKAPPISFFTQGGITAPLRR